MPKRSRRPQRVVLGVSGSIAAYKACMIVRGLVAAGAEVRCALTPAASKFVTPLTLSALSRHAVVEDLLDPRHWEMAHLSLASWADAVVIAPATANTLASLAHGRSADAVGATVLSTQAPVYVAPAMDTEMWEHPATRANIKILEGYGYTILGPVAGELASGRVGMGRLMEPADIVKKVLA